MIQSFTPQIFNTETTMCGSATDAGDKTVTKIYKYHRPRGVCILRHIFLYAYGNYTVC